MIFRARGHREASAEMSEPVIARKTLLHLVHESVENVLTRTHGTCDHQL